GRSGWRARGGARRRSSRTTTAAVICTGCTDGAATGDRSESADDSGADMAVARSGNKERGELVALPEIEDRGRDAERDGECACPDGDPHEGPAAAEVVLGVDEMVLAAVGGDHVRALIAREGGDAEAGGDEAESAG